MRSISQNEQKHSLLTIFGHQIRSNEIKLEDYVMQFEASKMLLDLIEFQESSFSQTFNEHEFYNLR